METNRPTLQHPCFKMINILIAEDHTMVRYGTTMILKDLYPTATIHQAINFEQLLENITSTSYTLLILDINIPGGDNIQMIDVIRLRQPDLKILIFSAYDEQVFAVRYVKAGVNGYLMKHAPEAEMRLAIQSVMRQDIYISEDIKQQLLFNSISTKKVVVNPLHLLSNRETEVMQELIKGSRLATIAQKLSLQVSTINTYKSRIFEKMEVNNVVELAQKVHLYPSNSE